STGFAADPACGWAALAVAVSWGLASASAVVRVAHATLVDNSARSLFIMPACRWSVVIRPFARRPREDRLSSRLIPIRQAARCLPIRPIVRIGEVAEVLQDALLPFGILEFPLECPPLRLGEVRPEPGLGDPGRLI